MHMHACHIRIQIAPPPSTSSVSSETSSNSINPCIYTLVMGRRTSRPLYRISWASQKHE